MLIVAFAVHGSGRREVIGIEISEAETETGWRTLLLDRNAVWLLPRNLSKESIVLVLEQASPAPLQLAT